MTSPSPSSSQSSALSDLRSTPPPIDTDITASLSPAGLETAARIARNITQTIKREHSDEDDGPSPTKRKRASRKKSMVKDDEDDFVATKAEDDDDVDVAPPKRRAGRRKKVATSDEPAVSVATSDEPAVSVATDDAEVPEEGVDGKKPRKPRKKPEPKLDENGNPIKRRRPLKPEPVYVIPDIAQHLSTSFRGRLGYACLNTVLRKKKPDPIFCSRTLRIATIKEKGFDYMKELGRQNAKDLLTLVQWNEENNIRFLRLSSEMFPFASHEEYGYSLEYCQEELAAVGALARKYGHRLTTHPGQFTQLTSPTDKTTRNAKRDLAYHCQILDLMGMGPESVMIIHGGGVHGDKEASLERLRKHFKELPKNIADRLVLENDEMCYNTDDLLPICEELEIPHVFDYHHDWINPSKQSVAELMPRILATWNVRGGIRPKFHLSEPRPGAATKMERRAHSDRIKRLPDIIPPDIDIMLEAKDKEQAVLELYRIYGLAEVKHESLRPPAENETLQTAGRKSHKKKKSADGEEPESGDESPLSELGDPESPIKPKAKRAGGKKRTQDELEQCPPCDQGLAPNPEELPIASDTKVAIQGGLDKPPEATAVEAAPEIEPPANKPKRKRSVKAKKAPADDE